MKDITDLFELDQATLAYVDGPQEGFVRERATGRWYRFRCLAVPGGWLWILVGADGPSTIANFERLDWTPERRFLERPGAVSELVRRARPAGCGVVRVASLDAVPPIAPRCDLPATGIDDRSSLFAVLGGASLLDPPLAGSGSSLDALNDALSAALLGSAAPRLQVRWPNARPFAERHPGDFELVLWVLDDVCADLASGTWGPRKEVSWVVECLARPAA